MKDGKVRPEFDPVGLDVHEVTFVLLDGEDLASRRKPRALHRHRAGTCADIPHDAVLAKSQLRQAEGADLALGNQALLRFALMEFLIRKPKPLRGAGASLRRSKMTTFSGLHSAAASSSRV